MVVEWLRVRVDETLREQYVQKDDEIWTAALARYSSFMGKEVWISPDDLTEVVLIVRWSSYEEWQSIPTEDLERVEAEFAEAMGDTYEILESKRYQVRKVIQG